MAAPGGGQGDEDSSRISPWEMFNAGLEADEVLEEAPSLPQDARSRMLAAVRRAGQESRFELFLETPSPTIFHSASTATGDPLQPHEHHDAEPETPLYSGDP